MIKFYLNKKDYSKTELVKQGYRVTTLEVLNESQADIFLAFQTQAAQEIDEEINVLPKDGLIKKLPFRFQHLFFYLVYNGESLIGYGYSHDDFYEKGICQINTIYLDKNHRGKGVSELLVRKIIEHNLDNNESLCEFKAVTQTNNGGAIKLLDKLSFKNRSI